MSWFRECVIWDLEKWIFNQGSTFTADILSESKQWDGRVFHTFTFHFHFHSTHSIRKQTVRRQSLPHHVILTGRRHIFNQTHPAFKLSVDLSFVVMSSIKWNGSILFCKGCIYLDVIQLFANWWQTFMAIWQRCNLAIWKFGSLKIWEHQLSFLSSNSSI